MTAIPPRSALVPRIPKCAGTSLVATARRLLPAGGGVSHGDFKGKSAEEPRPLPFVSGHFGYRFAKPLMSGRYTVTILREPAGRLPSFYCYCRGGRSDVYEVFRWSDAW